MRRAFLVALLLLIWPSLSPASSYDTYPRSTSIDALHYLIRIEIKETSDDINAETEILFSFKNDGVKTITLDLVGMTVDDARENGRATKYSREDAHLNVALQGEYHRGDQARVAIKYHGRPDDGLFIKKNKFGDRSAFADNWPNRAHHWFPAIDHPYDKATVEFFVTAPARYDVIANGALIETTNNQDGTRLTHWREATPIPTYCMVIGATEFAIINAGAWN